MRFIPLKNTEKLQEAGIFYSTRTLYKYHSEGIMPEVFVKVGRKVLIDTLAWQSYIDNALSETQKKAERIQKLKGV